MEKPFVFTCGDLAQTGLEQKDAEVDNGFGDWTVCNSTTSETFERSYGDERNPWVVFQQCFPELVESKETNYTIRTLSQLLENNAACYSQPSATIRDSGSLWSHLVAEPSRLRLSEPVPSLHCQSRMASALKITQSHCEQSVEALLLKDNEETLDETSCPSAASLIKTKLLAPSSCHGDTPAFLYQVSQRWLAQCSMQLQLQHHKKSTALKY